MNKPVEIKRCHKRLANYIQPSSSPTSQSHQTVIFVLPVSYLLQQCLLWHLGEAKLGSWGSQMSGSTKKVFSSGSCLADHIPPKAYVWLWQCICWWPWLVFLKVICGISSQWETQVSSPERQSPLVCSSEKMFILFSHVFRKSLCSVCIKLKY